MTEMRPRFWGWALSSDPFVIESLGRAGYDAVVCDAQHGSQGFSETIRAIQLLDVIGVPVLIRISSMELASIPRYLDFGASGVVVATVDDAATARAATRMTLYQPQGSRSYGGARFGLTREPADVAQVKPAIWAMIETLPGVSNIDEIASVDGLTGLLVGPADLSRAYGLPPTHRREDARWNEAISGVIQIAQARGIRSCMTASDGRDAARWVADGFTDAVIASDIAHLRVALARELAAATGELASDLVVEI